MRFPSHYITLVAFLSLPVSTNLRPRRPQPRNYDTHSYYTLELSVSSNESLAFSVAQSLGVELVEPLGELAGHWLVRTVGGTPHHDHFQRSLTTDPILQRWNFVRKQFRRSIGQSHLRSLTPLVLRSRAKRDAMHHSPLRRPTASHDIFKRDDDTELLYAQNEIGLADPMLNQQWHLINTEMQEVELNVTGLWSRGITGSGVHVVIVDDGLDLNSDDLHDNFVSFEGLSGA